MALRLALLLLPLWQKALTLALRQRKAQVEPEPTFIKHCCGARLCSTTRRTGWVLLWGGTAHSKSPDRCATTSQLDKKRKVQRHWFLMIHEAQEIHMSTSISSFWWKGDTLHPLMYRLRTRIDFLRKCSKIFSRGCEIFVSRPWYLSRGLI